MRDSTPKITSPVLNSIAAQLFVSDLQRSVNFYIDKLGFTADFVYGEPPFYAQVSRDEARLAMRFVEEPVFAGDIREREDLLSASITVANAEDVEELFRRYQASGVPIHQELKKEPWGAQTFIVKDPDGNLILFAGPSS